MGRIFIMNKQNKVFAPSKVAVEKTQNRSLFKWRAYFPYYGRVGSNSTLYTFLFGVPLLCIKETRPYIATSFSGQNIQHIGFSYTGSCVIRRRIDNSSSFP